SLALERGSAFCDRGDLTRGLLWLARGLEVAPGDAPELQRPLRTLLAGWGNQSTLPPSRAELRPEAQDAPLWEVTNPGNRPVNAAYSPDGKVIVTLGGEPGQDAAGLPAYLRHADTGKAFGKPISCPPGEAVFDRGWCPFLFSPDGETLLTAEGGAGVPPTATSKVRFWDARTGEPRGIELAIPDQLLSACFSPDGKVLAT